MMMPLLDLVILVLVILVVATFNQSKRLSHLEELVRSYGQKTLPDAVTQLVEVQYRDLLESCLARQPEHEAEHLAHMSVTQSAKGRTFTDTLRVEAMSNRLERKIHEAGLPPLSKAERRRRVQEVLCRSR